ncbi:MAG: hypothetical protein M3R02_23925 [Chloroflexota bacterium]|nr:hypothetical protein [Chloroflexota bacterium]
MMSSRVLHLVSVLLIAGLVLAAGSDRGPARPFAARANQSAPTSAVLPSPPGGTPAAGLDLEDLGLEAPAGVTLALLGSGVFGRLPTGPVILRLDRLPLAPGESTAEIRSSGPHLLYVETGSVILTGVPGLVGTYGPGADVPLPTGASYTLRNDATEPASLLRLDVAPGADTTPAALGTPVDASAQVLLTVTVPRLQQQPTSYLFLARTTWDPGADTGWRTYPGPLGMVVETGALLVSGPNRATFQLQTGEGILAPAFAAHRVQNAREEPVTALVAAVISGADRGQARGPGATPTQPVDVPATAAAATIEALTAYQATAEAQLASADAQADTAAALAATTTAQAATLATVMDQATAAGLAAVATTQVQSTREAALQASAEVRATDAAGAAATIEAQAASNQATVAALLSEQATTETEAATPRAAATAAQATRAALAGTVETLATGAAETDAARVTAEAAATAGAGAAAAEAATPQAAATAASATVAALSTAAAQVAGTSTALAATSTAAVADMDATATAAAAQAERTASDLRAAADAAQSTSAALAGTVETLATSAAETDAARATAAAAATAGAGAVAATIEAQRARETTLAATATADIRVAEATVGSLGSAVASVQSNLAAVEATAATDATSAAGALATGEALATAAGATSEAEAANAGATIAAMAAEGSAAGTVAAATATAQEATVLAIGEQAAGAEATNVALAATATADASASRATATAQAATQTAGEAALASVEAQATVAQATALALATRQAETASIASSAIDPAFIEEPIQVDPDGLLAGEPVAQEAARAELRRILAPYADGCRAGVVLTFGHSPAVEVGTAMAAAVNELLADEFPDLFEGAAFEDFVNVDPPVGQVDVRIYLFTGCEPAESEETPTPEPTAA